VALDVADEESIRRVEEHVAQCPECAARLQEFRESAALLGVDVPQVAPPPGLRERVMAAAAAESTPRPAPRRRRLWPIGGPVSINPAWVAVAASLAVSIISVSWAASLQNQVANLQSAAAADRERAARIDHIVGVLASDNLTVRRLMPVSQSVPARGVLYFDATSGQGTLMCRDMPPVDADHIWQLWFVRGSERVSGAMLRPDGAGNAYAVVNLPPDVQSFESVGITQEPANQGRGSAAPTTPRFMGGPLKESSQ
jgi:hypothetical protein